MHLSLNGNNVPDLLFLLILNVCLIYAFRFIAPHIKLIDYPGGRKTHTNPTPLVGGLAIYLTLLAGVMFNNDWNSNFCMIILWAGAIVFIGCLDDISNVRWPIRLSVQVAASFGVVLSTGIKVTYLGSFPVIGAVELGYLSTAFTVFAVVGLTNAYNFMDGIDGLCGSLLLLPVSTIMLINYLITVEIDFYFIVLTILLTLFLIFNMSEHPKKKYLWVMLEVRD